MFICTQFIDQLPVNLLAQLVERCTGIAEVMGSNPIRAWNFFQVLLTTTSFSSVLSCEDLLISSLSMFLCQKHIPPCRELSVEHIPCQQSRMLVRWQQASHGFLVCTLCINILCSYWILPCKIPPLCQYSVIVTPKKIIFEEKSKFYVDCNISECKLSLTDAVM